MVRDPNRALHRPSPGFGTERHGLSVLLISVLVLALACSAEAPPGARTTQPAVLDIPKPDLSGAEEGVRQQIEIASQKALKLLDRDDPSKTADAMGQLGLLYFTYGFVDAAETAFANAQVLAPDDHRWHYLSGYLLQMEGRLPEAIANLERSLELQSDDAPSLVRLGRARLELAEEDAARPLFERALELDNNSAAALEGLGRVAAARSEHETAVGYLKKAIAAQPSATSLHHLLGLSYRNLGKEDLAREHLGRASDAPVQVEDPLLLSLLELGRSSQLYLVRAAEAMDAQRWDQAAALYRKALDLGSTDIMAHKALGFALEKLGDVEGALGQLHQALETGTVADLKKLDDEHAEILRIMGGLEVLHGREKDAIAHFERALGLDPERLDTRIKLANALARNSRLEDALAHYDRVLESQADNTDVLVKRGTLLANLQRREEALAAFETALASSPDDPEVRLRYAEALEFLGERRAADRQRAAVDPSELESAARADLLIDRGRRETRAQRFEVALATYSEVLKMDPKNIDARFERAQILGHLGRFEQATGEFSAVVEATPEHAPARRGLVTALLLQGRHDLARRQLQDSLRALPRDRGLAHALARLLAASTDDMARSGPMAVELATKVYQAKREPATAETLAMAFAEVGRFDRAVSLQTQLIEATLNAEAAASSTTVKRLQEELAAYRSRRAWRVGSIDEILFLLRDAPSSLQQLPG